MSGWVNQAWDDYSRRFPPSLPLDLKQIKTPRRAKNADVAAARRKEGVDLLATVQQGSLVVTLDVAGKTWSTVDLAQRLEDWMREGRDVTFMIGGPDGLSGACRKRADLSWSLGQGTYPHALVRVMVAEQLYRAWSITQNHPYHRD